MPEGPEARIIADQLSKVCLGKYLYSHVEYGRLRQIYTVGKQLYFIFENADALILNSSLGVYGHWLLWDVWQNLKAKREARAITKWGDLLPLGNGSNSIFVERAVVVYDDSMNYGKMKWISRDEAYKKMKTYPYDWMQMLFPQPACVIPVPPETMQLNKEKFIQICQKHAEKEILDVLMEQKYMSGIGNYIKSESLYLARINPFRLTGSLSLTELGILFEALCWIFRDSYPKFGMTHGDFIAPCGDKGRYQSVCYKLSVSRDGHQVVTKKRKESDRNTHWCPTYQQ